LKVEYILVSQLRITVKVGAEYAVLSVTLRLMWGFELEGRDKRLSKSIICCELNRNK